MQTHLSKLPESHCEDNCDHSTLSFLTSVNILHSSLPLCCLHCHTQQSLGSSPGVKAFDLMLTLSLDTAAQGHHHSTKTHSQLISGLME